MGVDEGDGSNVEDAAVVDALLTEVKLDGYAAAGVGDEPLGAYPHPILDQTPLGADGLGARGPQAHRDTRQESVPVGRPPVVEQHPMPRAGCFTTAVGIKNFDFTADGVEHILMSSAECFTTGPPYAARSACGAPTQA